MVSLAEKGLVASTLVQGSRVAGVLKNGKRFETVILPSESLWETLRKHGVNIEVYAQDTLPWYSILLFLLFLMFFFILIYLIKQMQGGNGAASKIFSVGKSRARFFSPNTVEVYFKDVAGVQEAKEDLKDVVEFLRSPERFEEIGARIPRGILLSGAPGNGKTLLARAVAGESNCPFFSVSGSDFVEVFVGVGASRARDLFAQARKHAPCIVFIDEIDAVGRQRGSPASNDEREQTLNQLLTEMDGFSTDGGAVIVLAATNRVDILDKALLRPGRFDRIIHIPHPDLASREQILKVQAKSVRIAPEVNWHKVARGTPGFTGADLRNLINEAALRASKRKKKMVEIQDLEVSRDKILLGAEQSSMVMSEKDKEKTAYHESGHTLVNVLLAATDPFHKVTIIPRGRSLGVSWSLPERDVTSHTRTEMEARIMVALGGYVAEKLIYNELSSGAASDLEKATSIARHMVCMYGMSELGPIYLYEDDHTKPSPYASQETAKKIDEQVQAILRQAHSKTEELLTSRRELLEKLARELCEKETLTAQEVYTLLDIPSRETHSFVPPTSPTSEEEEKISEEKAGLQ